ncbi:MAG TPA: PspC domain-containing protein [Bacteroidales bacterium]
MNTTQKLYRARRGKVLGGVCGGLGDYLNIDKVIVRILFILLAIFGGSGVLVYIILWIAIPEQDLASMYQMKETPDAEETKADPVNAEGNNKLNNSMVIGIIMVAVGLLFLLNGLLPMYNLWNFWPVVLIAAGILLISPELIKPTK